MSDRTLYNPFNPYDPYDPYDPYSPYGPYNSYSLINPYNPYTVYGTPDSRSPAQSIFDEERRLIGGTAHSRIGSLQGNDWQNTDLGPEQRLLEEKPEEPAKDEFPDGGLRAWMVVIGSMCVTFGTFGFVNAWGVFQSYYHEEILADVSPSAISWIGSIQYALVFFPGLLVGRLFDLGYFRIPQITASVVLVGGTFLTAECKEYWQFLICQGVGVGFASGFLFGPAIAVVSHWFQKRRGLAFGIIASGASIGGTVIPITVRKLIPLIGFPWAMRVIGFIELVVLGTSILTLRRRLPGRKSSGGLLNLSSFLHIPYSLYVLAAVISFLGLYTVLTYLEVYGREGVGLPVEFSIYLIPIANAASLVGRVGSGYVTDKLGPLNTLIPTRMGSPEDIGRRTGMLMTIAAIGALAGPPISGAILGKTDSYVSVGIYAGSMIIVCVLMLIAVKYAALKKFSAEKEQYSSRGHPPDLVEYDSSMDSARLDTRASGLRVGNVFIEDKFIILLGSCAGVFAVGINDTAMGANLPSIQEHYNLSYDVLSIVFLAGFGGYLISCVLNSVLQSVIGIRGVLLMAGFWYATGAMLIAFAPPFPVVMIGLMLMGIGGGFYDTCLTGVISHFESTKLMNIFYSFFGFGSLVSPFIVGALAKAGIKWNVFYWVPFSIAVLVTLCHLVLFKNYKIPSEDENTEHQGAYGRLKQVTRMQIIWVGIPLTILGFAINNILGNWLTLYLMEVKGSGPDVSRYQLSVYWAGLTFGRVFFSLPFINVSERAGNTLLVAALSGAIGVFWGVNSVPLNWLMVGAAGFCLGVSVQTHLG
ncbi:Riboflavin transporter MCH5 [Rhizoctonia solani AG-1 IB]|uniref:Riboflavin transporter MCH5 n=1 Tax=Thanatephorus cucumeris (strain AG1-IB / isolate 7/3/14) TaxID=1108050 RepID=M5BXY9_THACB|nr:Riboflavin transporter MCH5 [Rhizoctonia solani AG-1 IB]